MKRARRIALSALLVVFALAPVAVFGQEDGGQGQGGSGLSISPTVFDDFVLEPGQADLAKIQVKNITTQDVIARVFLNDFEPDGNTGNPKLIIDADERSARSIRDFVIGLDDVRINAGETVEVDVPIQIPDGAAPGAYYGAIRFTGVPVNESEEVGNSQLSLNASVAALILIEIPGEITEQIAISQVAAFLDGEPGSLFTQKPDVIGVEIENLGNGFSEPFGRVVVSGPFGGSDIFSYELNDTTPRGKVLPNTSRLYEQEFFNVKVTTVNGAETEERTSPITWPGRYTIQTNISHGDGGEVFAVTASFWYLPVWFVVVSLLLIIVVVSAVYWLVKKRSLGSRHRR